MTDTPDMRHIVVTWDLDEGTGLAIRYGEMSPYRASQLLRLASLIVAEHANLLDEFDDDEEDEDEVVFADDEEDDEEEDEE